MIITEDDFQGIIRAEKDKQRIHGQDKNWTAVAKCVSKNSDLSRRHARLGELERVRLENGVACKEQIGLIDHIMKITEVNDVNSVQKREKLDKDKEESAQEQEARKSILGMLNAGKKPEKFNPVGGNQMESDRRPDNTSCLDSLMPGCFLDGWVPFWKVLVDYDLANTPPLCSRFCSRQHRPSSRLLVNIARPPRDFQAVTFAHTVESV